MGLWRVDEHGGIVCECGNEIDKEGFQPCLENGEFVEPLIDGDWDDLYKCMRCNKIASLV